MVGKAGGDLPLPTSIRALFRDAEIGDDELLATAAAGPYDSAAVFLFARSGFCRFFCTSVRAIGDRSRPSTTDFARRRLRRTAGLCDRSDVGNGAGSGGGGGVDGSIAAASNDGSSDMSDDGGGSGDDGDGDDDGLPGCSRLTRRCGTSTASIKTPLRLRLRTARCGVGDGLRSPHKAATGARGAVPNTASAVCSRRPAGSGVVGCRRLR